MLITLSGAPGDLSESVLVSVMTGCQPRIGGSEPRSSISRLWCLGSAVHFLITFTIRFRPLRVPWWAAVILRVPRVVALSRGKIFLFSKLKLIYPFSVHFQTWTRSLSHQTHFAQSFVRNQKLKIYFYFLKFFMMYVFVIFDIKKLFTHLVLI